MIFNVVGQCSKTREVSPLQEIYALLSSAEPFAFVHPKGPEACDASSWLAPGEPMPPSHQPELGPWGKYTPTSQEREPSLASAWLGEPEPRMSPTEIQMKEYLHSFGQRRELTKVAWRELVSLGISAAYALVWLLESKNPYSMKPEDWSKLVLSRIETRATEGQLDQASFEQIDALLQVSWTKHDDLGQT